MNNISVKGIGPSLAEFSIMALVAVSLEAVKVKKIVNPNIPDQWFIEFPDKDKAMKFVDFIGESDKLYISKSWSSQNFVYVGSKN